MHLGFFGKRLGDGEILRAKFSSTLNLIEVWQLESGLKSYPLQYIKEVLPAQLMRRTESSGDSIKITSRCEMITIYSLPRTKALVVFKTTFLILIACFQKTVCHDQELSNYEVVGKH